MEGTSGKKPILPVNTVPVTQKDSSSGSAKPIDEGVSKPVVRNDSGYGSDDEQKKLSDYNIEAVDKKNKITTKSTSSELEFEESSIEGAALYKLSASSLEEEFAAILGDDCTPSDDSSVFESEGHLDKKSERATTPAKKDENTIHMAVRMDEKGELLDAARQLLSRTRTLIKGPALAQNLLSLNIQQKIADYEKTKGSEEAYELSEVLKAFAGLLEDPAQRKNEQALSQISLKKYEALAHSFNSLSELVKDAYFDNVTEECKDALRKSFGRFENPGSESFLRTRAQVGVDVNLAKLDGGFEVSTQLIGCDDTKLRMFANKKFSLRLTVGDDAVNGYVSGAYGEVSGRVFKNIEEFINFYGDSFLLALHSDKKSVRKVAKNSLKIKEAKQLKKKISSNIAFLNDCLDVLGLDITKEGRLKYGVKPKESPLAIKREVVEAQKGVRVANVFGVDWNSAKWDTTFIKKLPLFEQLKKHPDWFQNYDHAYFNMCIPSEKGGYLDKVAFYQGQVLTLGAETDESGEKNIFLGSEIVPLLSGRLQVLQHSMDTVARQAKTTAWKPSKPIADELHDIQALLKSLIKQNYQEYKAYCQATNRVKEPGNKRKKERFENERKGVNEADMLKRFMVTHGRLDSLYRQGSKLIRSGTEVNEDWIDLIEQDMSVPDIPIKPGAYEKHLMLRKELKGATQFNDTVVKLALGPFEGLVDIKYISSSGEENPDSDGDYLSVVLRGSLVGSASLLEDSLEAAFTKLLGKLPVVDSNAPLLIEPGGSMDTVLQGMKHLKMELFFGKGYDGHYYQQYRRFLSGEEVALQASGKVPAAGPVAVSGQVAVDRCTYSFKGEELGTNTLGYIKTRYNGWKIGDKPDTWQALITNKKHQPQLAKLMVNMVIEGENAHKEFDQIKAELLAFYQVVCKNSEADEASKKEAQTVIDKLNSKAWENSFSGLNKIYFLHRSSNKKTSEKAVLRSVVESEEYYPAIKAFQELLSACHKPYLEESSRRFQDVNPNAPIPYRKS